MKLAESQGCEGQAPCRFTGTAVAERLNSTIVSARGGSVATPALRAILPSVGSHSDSLQISHVFQILRPPCADLYIDEIADTDHADLALIVGENHRIADQRFVVAAVVKSPEDVKRTSCRSKSELPGGFGGTRRNQKIHRQREASVARLANDGTDILQSRTQPPNIRF